jgi:hypothetical protein
MSRRKGDLGRCRLCLDYGHTATTCYLEIGEELAAMSEEQRRYHRRGPRPQPPHLCAGGCGKILRGHYPRCHPCQRAAGVKRSGLAMINSMDSQA